jgi:biopolymer transport protein ExbD
MQLNPYNFKQYLAKPPTHPHLAAWLICGLVFAFLSWWTIPYMAPSAVALSLPKLPPLSLKNPPSAFVVFTANGYIYKNRLCTFSELAKALSTLPKRQTLLIAAEASTSLQDLLPLLNKAGSLGFADVAFTTRP